VPLVAIIAKAARVNYACAINGVIYYPTGLDSVGVGKVLDGFEGFVVRVGFHGVGLGETSGWRYERHNVP